MPSISGTEAEIREWCTHQLAQLLGTRPDQIDPDVKFARLGVDSANAVQLSHPALRRNAGAAFAAANPADGERLIVVQEIERTQRHHLDIDDIVGTIREAVVTEHEVNPAEIVLIAPGTLPKTTSGKIQRMLTASLWREGRLKVVGGAA